jgi:hypothetical protein
MGTLANFPMVSQLTTVTGDGRPSENAQFDCVAASIDAATRWLLGKPENSVFNPDHFKDVAYGEALRNSGTSASAYVEFCKSLGVHLYPIATTDYTHAIQEAHQLIQHGFPVIFTRDDPYVDQRVHPDWTHVCVFFGEDGAGLTALDPYIGKPVYKTDAGWENVLRNRELWVTERIEEVVTIDLSIPEVAKHYEAFGTTGNQWRCKDNGKVLQGAILDWYRKFCNHAYCGLTYLGLVQSNEIPLSTHGAVKAYFENGVVFYDPAHEFDTRPGAPHDAVYLAKAYTGPGVPPFVTDLQKQVVDLQKQLTTAPNNTALQQQFDAVNQKLAQFKALAASM